MQDRITVVVSDMHIGAGHRKGAVNFFDDFRLDRQFAALLRRYSSDAYRGQDVELVLNGDIFDLLKVSVHGQFTERITESVAIHKIERCLIGHPLVVRALAGFLAVPHKHITLLPGNHDMEFVFPGVQAAFTRALTGAPQDARVRYVADRPAYDIEGGVQIHHGHQFEAMHAFDFTHLWVERRGKQILNLPWGSLFILHVISRFKAERPYVDRVKPFWPLIPGGLLFDTSFTLRLLGASGRALLGFYLSRHWRHRKPVDSLRRLQELRFYGGLDGHARRLFKRDPSLRVITMGHVHTETCRSFARDRLYINTGCWVPMINLDIQNLGQNSAPHYLLVRYTDRGEPRASLMRWNGRRPVAEEVSF